MLNMFTEWGKNTVGKKVCDRLIKDYHNAYTQRGLIKVLWLLNSGIVRLFYVPVKLIPLSLSCC